MNIPQEFDKYRILQEIGSGGMGAVYLAENIDTGDRVAIKFIQPEHADNPDVQNRFEREIMVLNKLRHHHIVNTIEDGEVDGLRYFVMRYIDGGSVRGLLQGGPLTLDHTESILREIVGALEYAHSMGIFHRDIKPHNILLDWQGHAYLADFGIATDPDPNTPVHTSTSLLGGIGTPGYIAPELSEGIRADQRSDIYSLGTTLYEMLTAHKFSKAMTEGDPWLTVPRSIAEVLWQALQMIPRDRQASVTEFAQQFYQAANVDRQAEPETRLPFNPRYSGTPVPGSGTIPRPITQTGDSISFPPRTPTSKSQVFVIMAVAIFVLFLAALVLQSVLGRGGGNGAQAAMLTLTQEAAISQANETQLAFAATQTAQYQGDQEAQIPLEQTAISLTNKALVEATQTAVIAISTEQARVKGANSETQTQSALEQQATDSAINIQYTQTSAAIQATQAAIIAISTEQARVKGANSGTQTQSALEQQATNSAINVQYTQTSAAIQVTQTAAAIFAEQTRAKEADFKTQTQIAIEQQATNSAINIQYTQTSAAIQATERAINAQYTQTFVAIAATQTAIVQNNNQAATQTERDRRATVTAIALQQTQVAATAIAFQRTQDAAAAIARQRTQDAAATIAAACPSRTDLVVGGPGRVASNGTSNRLRSGPSTNAARIGELPSGSAFTVIDGPECADDYVWWKVEDQDGQQGWTAEGDDEENWLMGITVGTIPSNRRSAPSGSALLYGGTGMTNGAGMNAGNFQVEDFCQQQGYGIDQDLNNWYCINRQKARIYTLTAGDFDTICQITYNDPYAFAIQNGNTTTPAWNWRCYGWQ